MVKRRLLFDKMQEHDLPNFDEKLTYLQRYILSQEEYCEEQREDVKHKFSYLKSQFKERWTKAQGKLRPKNQARSGAAPKAAVAAR